MSLLTPTNAPVKVYRWDDVGAPALDKTAGCVIRIIQACLVDGYGSNTSAGWVMPFNNTATATRVFNINVQTLEDSYSLRLSSDTGLKTTVQLYKNMTDSNTGTLVMACDTEFKYGSTANSGKWVLIASNKALWFFAEGASNYSIPTNQCGSYLFAGAIPSDLDGEGIYIKHTGGTYSDGDSDRRPITSNAEDTGTHTKGVLINLQNKVVAKINPIWIFDGNYNQSVLTISSNLFLSSGGFVYQLPMYAPSTNTLSNFVTVDNSDGLIAINCCTSPRYFINNIYVPTDYWVY